MLTCGECCHYRYDPDLEEESDGMADGRCDLYLVGTAYDELACGDFEYCESEAEEACDATP